jgi:hypothetical protein
MRQETTWSVACTDAPFERATSTVLLDALSSEQ